MTQQINLFNPAFEPRREILTANATALAAAVLALGVAALAGYGQLRIAKLQAELDRSGRQMEKAQKRLADAAAEFKPAQKDPALSTRIADAERQQAALERVTRVIDSGDIGNTQGYAEYFRALARQAGNGVWLTGVVVVGAGREIGLKGRALDPGLVPGFLNRLRGEPVLQGKVVGNFQIGQAEPVAAVGADGKETSTPAPYVEFSLESAPVGAKP